ncbi:Crp/Fnr family transcriptional regulator [Mangrovibacterium sp.]|uniref:Crp/Fnr family transcriptional regulator n=1 Tax=Mangrovibacterium sp. TaxID=1961364 RepID=UPI00356A36AE
MSCIGPGYQQTFEQLKEFFKNRQPIQLKKGETFLNYGDPNRKLGILLSGLLYASYTSESGHEWISRFFYIPDNGIVSSHETFMTGGESNEVIRAYEDSELICIERNEYEELLETNPELHRLVRIMAEESYVQALQRVHTLQSLSASQRVKLFVKEHSQIVSRVQRQHVASYLGIHRNIFTRILNKI